MGNMRQWPEKLRRFMKNEIAQVVIGIVLWVLVIPAGLKAATNALVAWFWPKPEEVSIWVFLLIFLFIIVLFFTVFLTVFSIIVNTFRGSPQKDNVDRDS